MGNTTDLILIGGVSLIAFLFYKKYVNPTYSQSEVQDVLNSGSRIPTNQQGKDAVLKISDRKGNTNYYFSQGDYNRMDNWQKWLISFKNPTLTRFALEWKHKI